MDYEDYLAEEKYPIIAINRICQIIDMFIRENYYNFAKDKFYLDYFTYNSVMYENI